MNRNSHRLLRVLVICLVSLVGDCFSQTATISGNIANVSSSGVGSNAYLQAELAGCGNNNANYPGGVITAPFQYPTDANGGFTGTIVKNTSITCGNDVGNATYYYMQPFIDGQPTGPRLKYRVTFSPFDWNVATPITVSPVVPSPTGDSVYCRLDAGNCGFTGNISFTGGATFTTNNVTFTAATEALLRGCISVKDTGFNATGDGVTDDTTAIQAAMTAMTNSSCLVFPIGTYVTKNYLTVSNKSNITIIMLGSIKPSVNLGNTNSGMFFFSGVTNLDFVPRIINQTYSWTGNAIRLDNVQRANIHDGMIDLKMNSFDGTAAIQLGASTTDLNLHHNYICSGYGVLSNNVAGNARISIHDNSFEGQKRYGSTGTGDAIEMNDPTNGASQVAITGNTFFGYEASLVNSRLIVIGLANVNGFNISGNTVIDSESEAIHIESGSTNGVISNNQIGKAIHGINLVSNGASVTDVSITGNQIFPGAMAAIFSASSADYGCGILLNVGSGGFVSKNITISGNEVKGAASSSKGICAYDIDGGSITGNTVSDMTLAGIDIRQQNGMGVGPKNLVVSGNTVRNSALNYIIGGVTGGVGTLTGGAGPMIGDTFDNNWSYSGGTLNFDSEITTRTNSRIRIPYANLTLLKVTAGDVLYNPVPAINLPFEYLVTTSGATGVYVATPATRLTQTVTAATCATAAAVNASCTGSAINWPIPFTDATYKISCTLVGFTNQPFILGIIKSTGVSFTVSIAANSAAAASANVECTGGY